MQWAGIRTLCNPTVHDTLLHQQLARIKALTPREIRESALAIALEGHAGRDCMTAAKATIAADRAQRLKSNFWLKRMLIEQAEPGSAGSATSRTNDFERRYLAVLDRLAPGFRRPAAQVAATINALSDSFAPVGVAPNDRDARIVRLIDLMEQTTAEIFMWLMADSDHDLFNVGPTLGACIQTAVDWGRAVVASTRDILADPMALLTRRFGDSAGVAALAERADWLLDGWERVCQLWACAGDVGSRRVALLEMARCIPELPEEAFQWTHPSVRLEAPTQICRVTGGDRSWFAGSGAFALVERNEMMRARTL
jgi:hypothetical protein